VQTRSDVRADVGGERRDVDVAIRLIERRNNRAEYSVKFQAHGMVSIECRVMGSQ
jgi:hypothetical protein